MATTIDRYSDDLTLEVAPLYGPMRPNLYEGRMRIAAFFFTAAANGTGTDVALCKLPKGARIVSGVIAASGTLANSAQISIGLMGADGNGYIDDTSGATVADSTTFLKAAAIQGATQVGFALTAALGYLYETKKEVYVTMTTSVGALTTEVIRGHVMYVVD